MKPSLDNAYARVRRAKQHLARLKREVTLFWRSNPEFAVNVGPGLVGIFTSIEGDLPPIISILIGEIVYNLRAALDYLIYELAILDSGKVQDGTQFPIEDDLKKWKKQCYTRLKKISCKHKTMVKKLQPFSECNWTARLRDISNPDKHRHLVASSIGTVVPFNVSETSYAVKPPTRMTTNIQDKPALKILFDDGHPIIETLHDLKNQVTNVLDNFNPEF